MPVTFFGANLMRAPPTRPMGSAITPHFFDIKPPDQAGNNRKRRTGVSNTRGAADQNTNNF